MAATAAGVPAPRPSLPADELTLARVLNRLTFGARPRDVETVRHTGLEAYLDDQLHPERIPDVALEARLAGLPTLGLKARVVAEQYVMPLEQARRERRAAAGQTGADSPVEDDEVVKAAQKKANQPVMELTQAKVLRAVYSERQLQEVLVDFWFNHFNVDVRKGADRIYVSEYEREAIRPHVLGRFRDLLGATAKSPAMLFYLDNWMSADPAGPHAPPAAARPRRGFRFSDSPKATSPGAPPRNNPRGLNENYARELMELHTLGVDGGYSQADVQEVARCFTGWTIERPQQGGAFAFDARLHDPGEKRVLGHRIRAGGGQTDGEQVLDLLATHPATARFIATKLVRRFVADVPPTALVDRAAKTFRETKGDLREVMRTIVLSPEFLSRDERFTKLKSPFEFVVSALRLTGAEVLDATPLARQVQQLGMPLYQCQPPTGYKDTREAWVNSGALVARMNFAVALSANKLPGARVDTLPASEVLLSGDRLSEATAATVARAKGPQQAAALTLGSPEFQRR